MPLRFCVGAVSEREERNHAQQKGGHQKSRVDTKTLFVGLLMPYRQYDSTDGSGNQGCQTSMAQMMAKIVLNATPNAMG